MAAEVEPASRPHRLRVHIRGLRQENGKWTADLGVTCPIEQRSVSVDECIACWRSEGLHNEPGESEVFLLCDVEADAVQPLAPLREQAAKVKGALRVVPSRRRVYFFGGDKADGTGAMRELLGGKGAGLAEMVNLGIPVPPGVTITTEVCSQYLADRRELPPGLIEELQEGLARIEVQTGSRFGDAANPLLLSVRSGARVSMPGMMDTVLNLGLNDVTVEALAKHSGSARFAYDSYRRFLAMFGDVVLSMKPASKEDRDPFAVLLEQKKQQRNVQADSDLDVDALRELVGEYKAAIERHTGAGFPEDPMQQLAAAVKAVFDSWGNDRAIAYRELNDIPGDWGTAVNVQAMVFGNRGSNSATGVAFTRDPASGENRFYGEFLINAQGEDVVAGVRTPEPVERLAQHFPDAYRELLEVRQRLETHFGDMQDLEFTIEDGKLYVLQTRNGKRTGFAAVRIAVEMAQAGTITEEEAVRRVEPAALEQLLRPVFRPEKRARALAEGRILARGLPAGPGAATGRIVFFAEDAMQWAARGEPVILCRHETSPEDIRGMNAALGILTAFGGMTSHAALVARQMGKVAIVGCGACSFDYRARELRIATADGVSVLSEGDYISLDGFSGDVIAGRLETAPSEVVQVLVDASLATDQAPVYQRYAALLGWADRIRKLSVCGNADQPEQARVALAFGAEGIGLCRTEHMFFGEGKILPMREMIVAADEAARRRALAKLLPAQRADFAGLFRVMAGRPVTIRTLDPPLHEFLPHDDQGIVELARALGCEDADIRARIEALSEENPMLGHRGCRLGITYPEITEMQARAIFEAACDVAEEGLEVHPEVMIPLVGAQKEFTLQAMVVRETAAAVFLERQRIVPFKVGTMIELPRAALIADQVAHEAEFFSFGTNDLTQTTFGLSRDDAGAVLDEYLRREIHEADPFVSIDRDGVGELMRIGVERGRRTRAELKVGICGEHGGDPRSIALCQRLGLDYVSCSAYRLSIARLAAAQAALANG